MKKLELKRGNIREVLTRDQMKIITGGQDYPCYVMNGDGGWGSPVSVPGDNCCQAQALGDIWSYSSQSTDTYPYGIDCPCPDEC